MAGKGGGAPLVGRVKGDAALGQPVAAAAKPAAHGAGGVVFRLGAGIKGPQRLLHRRGRPGGLVQRHRVAGFHLSLGDGAGLVHAQNVHAGQCLDAVHVLGQHPAAGKPQHADRQRHAGQKVKPFRDHADQRRHRGLHRVPQRQLQHVVLLQKQQDAKGDQQKADGADQLVQREHHLAFGQLDVGFGLGHQPVGVGVRAHPRQLGAHPAGGQKAAGAQPVPRLLGHRLGLAGDQGLVGLGAAGAHHRVGADLLAGGKFHNIVPHQLAGGQLQQVAVPQAAHLVGGHQRQLVHRVFGAQLLHDADDGVAHRHDQEPHVGKAAHRPQQRGQHHKHQVEKGEGVFPHDLPGGLGGAGDLAVVQPGFHAAGGLGGGQAGIRVGVFHRQRRVGRGFGPAGARDGKFCFVLWQGGSPRCAPPVRAAVVGRSGRQSRPRRAAAFSALPGISIILNDRI